MKVRRNETPIVNIKSFMKLAEQVRFCIVEIRLSVNWATKDANKKESISQTQIVWWNFV